MSESMQPDQASHRQSLHLLTGAYAVNALDPAERDEFEAHLAQCTDCSTEVRGLLDIAARLAAAEATAPPARLKAAAAARSWPC
jgi:anti-sigma factor RsiW